jgi:hypothetical protein
MGWLAMALKPPPADVAKRTICLHDNQGFQVLVFPI